MLLMKRHALALAAGLAFGCGAAFAQTPIAEFQLEATASDFTPAGGGGVDETPVEFSFTPVTDVEPGDVVIATPTVTVAGVDATVTAETSGDGNPQFRIDAGALQTSAPVQNGDVLELSLETAAGAFSTTYTATLQVGTYSTNFEVMTRPPVTVSLAEAPAAIEATLGQPFSYDFSTLATASGGRISDPATVSDLVWTVGAGSDSLPAWLSLNGSTGAVSGTPDVTGSASFEMVGSYLDGEGRRIYSITVNGLALDILQVSAGGSNTCAVTADNELKCWGRNTFGIIGSDVYADATTPILVALAGPVSQVAVGNQHACAVLVDGRMQCWGDAASGRLGTGTGTSSSTAWRTPPGFVLDASGAVFQGAQKVAAGGAHSCAINASGAAFCWGSGFAGALGDGTGSNSDRAVAVVNMGSGVTDIALGRNNHTCAIKDGAAWCWGENDRGMLGNGTTTDADTPVQVTGLTSDVTDIDVNFAHSCAVHSGVAKCWGLQTDGRIASGSTSSISLNTATSIRTLSSGGNSVLLGSGVTAVSTTEWGGCVIHNGIPKCWGRAANRHPGRVVNFDNAYALPIIEAETPWSSMTILAIDGGFEHSCLESTQGVYCWGDNAYGQVGIGSTLDAYATAVSFE
jgi:alpha-tubulin suppressor-like RCC1 family protein